MSVKKSGRTTALTTGSVTSLAAKITITYSTGQKAIFVNQIGFSQFDQAGDSGSLIVQNVDPSPAPVALLTGQAKKGGSVQTFGNPIGDVLAYFKVCFVDSSGTCVAPASAVGAGQPLLADPKLQAIYSVTQRYDAVLSAIPGVVGYGIGHSSNGAGQLVIQVFVVDASRIRGILPAALDKVPIEIIETGEIQAR
jgi:hypothetical protein